MTGTALDHPLVRDYLHDLDSAFAALPAGEARELREQITAHLDDALRPDSDDQEVALTLLQLGSPANLAAEASAGTADATAAGTAGGAQRPRRARLGWPRLGWRGWTLTAGAVVIVAAVSGYIIAAGTAAPIQDASASSWWFPRDSARAVDTQADGAEQTAIPIRSGQEQGFAITVDNPSDWTQTVLGPAGYGNSPGSLTAQIGVATADPYHGGGVFLPLHYKLPESIPPHQTRALRVLWTSTVCLGKGGSQGINQVRLRVRVATITRTETIQLPEGFFVTGPSQGRCS
jgi:hypothetical protein